MGPRQVECFLFVNSVNGFALRTDWANFVCLSSPSFDSVRNYYFFFFFPPDFFPPEDLEAADFFEDPLLDFFAEDLPPFLDFWTWAGPPPDVPPPPELDPLE